MAVSCASFVGTPGRVHADINRGKQIINLITGRNFTTPLSKPKMCHPSTEQSR
jgi:hypothetical protein